MSSFNSLWPSGPIWQHRSGSTLAQAMACCLTAPNHHLNNVDLSSWRSSDIHLREIWQEIPQPSVTKMILKNYLTKLSFKSPRDQWGHKLDTWTVFTFLCQTMCVVCCQVAIRSAATCATSAVRSSTSYSLWRNIASYIQARNPSPVPTAGHASATEPTSSATDVSTTTSTPMAAPFVENVSATPTPSR